MKCLTLKEATTGSVNNKSTSHQHKPNHFTRLHSQIGRVHEM